MTVLVQDIISQLDDAAPFSLAESWDNVGLLVGSATQQASSLLIGLDPTNSLVDEAIATGADTIITHHPVIFQPLPCINTADPAGRLLAKALAHQIAIIACHTNLDSAAFGVSDILGAELGLEGLTPLLAPPGSTDPRIGLGRIGHYPDALETETFLERLFAVLKLPTLPIAGPLPEKVRRVAVCGGSGSDLAQTAHDQGADIYLTAEVKHATARWAEEHRFCIVDGSHYGTEQPAVRLLAETLSEISRARGWDITITQTQTEKHPFVSIGNKEINTSE